MWNFNRVLKAENDTIGQYRQSGMIQIHEE